MDGAINLTDVHYSGANNDLLELKSDVAANGGIVALTFQFVQVRVLTNSPPVVQISRPHTPVRSRPLPSPSRGAWCWAASRVGMITVGVSYRGGPPSRPETILSPHRTLPAEAAVFVFDQPRAIRSTPCLSSRPGRLCPRTFFVARSQCQETLLNHSLDRRWRVAFQPIVDEQECVLPFVHRAVVRSAAYLRGRSRLAPGFDRRARSVSTALS